MKEEFKDIKFNPVIIILETQEEVNALFALVNYSPIYNTDQFYRLLQEALNVYKTSDYVEFNEKLAVKLT